MIYSKAGDGTKRCWSDNDTVVRASHHSTAQHRKVYKKKKKKKNSTCSGECVS